MPANATPPITGKLFAAYIWKLFNNMNYLPIFRSSIQIIDWMNIINALFNAIFLPSVDT